LHAPVQLLAGVADEPVEGGAVVALGPLLKLRVDLESHLGVDVPDLVMTPTTSKLLASSAIEM